MVSLKKYLKYSFIVLAFAIVMSFSLVQVQAKTLQQLKDELEAVDEKYRNNQLEKQQTEAQIAATKKKITDLSIEKEKVQAEIEALNEELIRLADEIKRMDKEMKSIINYYQLSNTNSIYLEYAFNAKNFTDFIYRLAVTEQLSDYRKKTIDKYNALIEENKKKLSELADKQASLNKLEKELSNQLKSLGSNLSSITEEAVGIKDEINELKKQIDLYENNYKCYLDEEIPACIERVSTAGIPLSFGFYRPTLSGRVNADYGYTAYYGDTFHYGLDVGVSHGTPVYSVAAGKVVKIFYKQPCGGNMVHIVHNVNGKKYTSQYAHLASVAVSEGDTVTYDTVIGYSGGVPWIETWDGCSTGAHLHFQMATGAYTIDYYWYSDFQARHFDPRKVISFPAWHQYFYGR